MASDSELLARVGVIRVPSLALLQAALLRRTSRGDVVMVFAGIRLSKSSVDSLVESPVISKCNVIPRERRIVFDVAVPVNILQQRVQECLRSDVSQFDIKQSEVIQVGRREMTVLSCQH